MRHSDGLLRRRLVVSALLVLVAIVSLTSCRPATVVWLDDSLYDALTRSVSREPPHGHVVIVDIDERSLAGVGQWPWPRDVVARLLDRIRDLGASTVALDIVFPERDREVRAGGDLTPLPSDHSPGVLPPTPTDAALADSLRLGSVVLGYAMTFDAAAGSRGCHLHPLNAAVVQPEDGEGRLYRASGAVCNLTELAEAAGASGFLNAAPDSDGILRRVPLLIELDDRVYPSLALAALMMHAGIKDVALRVAGGNTTWLHLDDRQVPLDGKANLLVRYLGPERTFHYVSAVDVLTDRVTGDDFAGKLVLVGATALGTQEDIATPVQPLFAGVEVHATLVESLLEGRFVHRPALAAFSEALFVLLALPVVWAVSRAGAAWAGGFAIVVGGLLWLMTGWLFSRGVFMSPLPGTVSVAAAFFAAVMLRLRDERTKAAAQAEDAIRAAAAAESVKHEVLRKASHELRTPLTVIAGWAHMLGIGALTERQKRAALATIRHNVKVQTKLIEDLVDASQLADADFRLRLREVDVRDVAAPVIARYEGLLAAKGIRFEVAIGTGDCVVSGDPGRLQQVIDALLSNAAKFSRRGGAVRIGIGPADSNVEIVVSDDGVGIAPSFQPHVFDFFRQERDMTTQQDGGLGLGLSIVEQLVRLHGGAISVESKGEDQGATFVVWLPAARPRR